MFGKYALASDDLAGQTTGITVGGTEDSEYPAENIVATSGTGHLNLPSRPAKLEDTSGYWELAFSSAITVYAVAVIYHNFDAGLDVTLEAGNGGSPLGFSTAITIPAHFSDNWTVSPWKELSTPQTFDTWRLSINEANSLPIQVGRLLLLGALRQLDNDVRYGVVETETHQIISHRTQFGVETIYDMGGKERAVNGEVAVTDSVAADFLNIFRVARNRVQPWLLIPDEDVNDAWFVRAEDPFWSRTQETINHNIFPFRVRELSRGLPWP